MTSPMANAKILLLYLFFLLLNEVKQLAQLASHMPSPVFHEVFHLLRRNKEHGSSLITEFAHNVERSGTAEDLYMNRPRSQDSAPQ